MCILNRFAGWCGRSKQYGFTLIEVLVTISVIAIVMAIAMPSFKSQISRNKAEALNEDFIFAVSLARSEAVKRGNSVTICASDNGATCSLKPEGWGSGYLIAVDFAVGINNPVLVPPVTNPVTPTPPLIRVWQQQDPAAEFRLSQLPGIAAADVSFIRFTNTGALGNSAAGINILTKMKSKAISSDCEADSAKNFVISLVGMLREQIQPAPFCW